MDNKKSKRAAKVLLAAAIGLTVSGHNPLFSIYLEAASNILKIFEMNNYQSYINGKIRELEDNQTNDLRSDINTNQTAETEYDKLRKQDYKNTIKFIDNDLYSVTASAIATGCIDDDLTIETSELNDYFMDDRKGRLVNFYSCNELVYGDLYYGIVNKAAIEGPVIDFTYSPEAKTEWLTVYFNIDTKDYSLENYEIYKAEPPEGSNDETMVLVPVTTCYDNESDRVYTIDDISETGKVTYALINKSKLEDFHQNVNGTVLTDALSAPLAKDSYFYLHEFSFLTDPDFSSYSETEDNDGDGISNRMEMYLGTDPYSPVTRGVPDSEIRFVHKADPEITKDISDSNSKFDVYIEALSSSDINDKLTVNVSSLSDKFRNNMNGRLVNTTDRYGNSIDVIYDSILNPSAIEGDIIEVSFDSTEDIEMIRAAFVFPEGTPEEEIRNYIIAPSKSCDEPFLTTNNDNIRYEGNTIFYPYLRDVKSLALVDMRKLKKFTYENNHMSLDEERELPLYSRSYLEAAGYSIYQ